MEMDIKMEVETPTKTAFKNCWFLVLPHETRDYIASFLPFDDYETEEEFINRTKALKIKYIPEEYFEHLPHSQHHSNIYSAYCPNNHLCALLQQNGQFVLGIGTGDRRQEPPVLAIINQKNNTLLKIINLDKRKSFFKIAISRDGNLLGTIHKERDYNKTAGRDFKNILTITNFAATKTETHDIPPFFELTNRHPTITFNKQGTHIIIHGDDAEQYDDLIDYGDPCNAKFANPIPHHKIISLTVNTPDLDVNNKKTLAKYFAQQGVCKNFNKQLALTQ